MVYSIEQFVLSDVIYEWSLTASSKFQWFRLAGLEKLSSIQSMQLDEDLDKLDSASVLQVQAAAAAAAATGKFLVELGVQDVQLHTHFFARSLSNDQVCLRKLDFHIKLHTQISVVSTGTANTLFVWHNISLFCKFGFI